MRYRDLRLAERIALALVVLGFAFGAGSHALDFIRFGWLPYRFGPPVLNCFWNALVLLDGFVVGLLLAGRRRAGLAMATVVMIVDVAANSYAWFGLGFDGFAVSVPLQTAFLGVVLATTLLLWRTVAVPAPLR